MNRDIQTELMTAMAEALPLKHLFRQVEKAIHQHREDPTEESLGYVIFTMQIALMGHVMRKGNKTAEELKSDMTRHEEIMNLFKENNN